MTKQLETSGAVVVGEANRPRRNQNDLSTKTIGTAMRLAGAVHDYQTITVADILTTASRDELHAVCVTLAAMVDVDQTPSQMLAWNDDTIPEQPVKLTPALRPHGTHSAFARHKSRGETPCAECIEGERTYQRLRKRRNRSESAA